ncbi:hypothetical protein AJ79_01913 [Helicocarpus griseus UAMH5409]|uniref:Uncharacterized protein n=1 Tax=Helicocarpus griseus UAMH5409 TaxID=1447875 RepID=A0A2B7Y3S8_9EURO|nr:hypothetical protein AJ79_01913 [Helicocarpus griseus UAMH5409]
MRIPSAILDFQPILLLIPHLASAQWEYPPNLPSNKNIADYTSGAASPITDYHEWDIIVGGFSTPKPSFSLTRCAKEGRTEPIYPSNSTFNSSVGHLAADGTWEIMDGYQNGAYPNVYRAGDHPYITPIWHLIGNETTGHICWLELYSVVSEQVRCYPSQEMLECDNWATWEVTVLGNDTENYFATVPFNVQAGMREGGKNWTWNHGDHTASRTTLVFSNRPTGNAAEGLRDVVYGGMQGGGLIAGLVRTSRTEQQWKKLYPIRETMVAAVSASSRYCHQVQLASLFRASPISGESNGDGDQGLYRV